METKDFETDVIRPIECYKEGWQLIKGQYWFLFAISVVGAMIGGISMYILIGAMVSGIFICYFKVIDGEKVEFEDLFKGLKYFKPSLLIMILFVVPIFLVIALMYLPIVASLFWGPTLSDEEFSALLFGMVAFDFAVSLLMVCFHTLIIFAFPLVVDRNLSGIEAIKLSIKSVWKNLSGVAGLWTIGFFVSLVGMLFCIVGIYFTIPIIIAGNAVAFRKVFPTGNVARITLPTVGA